MPIASSCSRTRTATSAPCSVSPIAVAQHRRGAQRVGRLLQRGRQRRDAGGRAVGVAHRRRVDGALRRQLEAGVDAGEARGDGGADGQVRVAGGVDRLQLDVRAARAGAARALDQPQRRLAVLEAPAAVDARPAARPEAQERDRAAADDAEQRRQLGQQAGQEGAGLGRHAVAVVAAAEQVVVAAPQRQVQVRAVAEAVRRRLGRERHAQAQLARNGADHVAHQHDAVGRGDRPGAADRHLELAGRVLRVHLVDLDAEGLQPPHDREQERARGARRLDAVRRLLVQRRVVAVPGRELRLERRLEPQAALRGAQPPSAARRCASRSATARPRCRPGRPAPRPTAPSTTCASRSATRRRSPVGTSRPCAEPIASRPVKTENVVDAPMPALAAAAARAAGTVLARVMPPLSTKVTVSSSAAMVVTAGDGTAACRTGQDGVGSLHAPPHPGHRRSHRPHRRRRRCRRPAPQPRRRPTPAS